MRPLAVAAALTAASCGSPTSSAPTVAEVPQVLVFSKTLGFRHSSIPFGIDAIRRLGADHGFEVTATEDASQFTGDNLVRFDAVVWLSTTGDILDPAQQQAFEEYVAGGGGYVGVHSAADTEYEWGWYAGLVGALFADHPAIQPATVIVEDRSSVATAHLGERWSRADEWYNFRSNPRGGVRVLLSIDESTYTGGTMGDHPITWCHDVGAGRAFYTALGHTDESYSDASFLAMLLGGIQIAAGMAPADCSARSAGLEPAFAARQATRVGSASVPSVAVGRGSRPSAAG
jgi:type 1 glutamine amidotransferase